MPKPQTKPQARKPQSPKPRTHRLKRPLNPNLASSTRQSPALPPLARIRDKPPAAFLCAYYDRACIAVPWTIVFRDTSPKAQTHPCLLLSLHPDYPNGVSNWEACYPDTSDSVSPSQRRLTWQALPEAIKAHVLRRLALDWPDAL